MQAYVEFHVQFLFDATEYAAQPGSASSRRPGGMFGSFGSGLNQVPVIPIVIILVAIIALVIAWRKGVLNRFTGRFHKKEEPDDDEPKEQ